jgi:hypothetical protein
MDWFAQNWIWILLGAWFVAAIVFGDATREREDSGGEAAHPDAGHGPERAADESRH